jgi:hypothetical protein
MCVSTVNVWDIGEKTVRSSTEPARIQLQQHILNEAPNLSADTVNDKYFNDCNFSNCYENNVTEFEIFSEQVNYFENNKLYGSFKGVKGKCVVVVFWLALLKSGQFFLQCPILLQWKHTSQGHGSRRAKPVRKGG